MNLGLRNKKAIVCGSTQGIGKAIAMELAALGVNVTCIARNQEALENVIQNLDTSLGQNHNFYALTSLTMNFLKKFQF